MENNEILPIKLQMALAHNKKAFEAFLKMDEKAQNEVIMQAKSLSGVREINNFVNSFVNSLPQVH